MILFLMILFTYLLCEYRCYKTCITPFFVLGIIYFISVPFINIVGPKLGYYQISNKTIYIFILYLSFVFFSDLLFKVCAGNNRFNEYSNRFVMQQKIIWYVFCFLLFGYLLSFVQAVKIYGIGDIKGKSNGIFGHMGLACVSISPIIVVLLCKIKKLKYFIGIVSLYLIMLLFGGKTYIFISIITSGILLNIKHKLTFTKLIKLGVILALSAVAIFLIIYAIIPCIRNGITDIASIEIYLMEALQHLFYYFAAPFLSSNTYFSMPLNEGFETGLRIMFAPVVSLYEFLLGNKNYPNIIMTEWALISETAHRTVANVGGLFSESVFHIGYFYSFLYIFMICVYVNIMFNRFRKINCFYASASLAITLLGLCFFVNYFTLLVVLEMIVYLMLFELFLQILEKKKIYIKDWRLKRTWKTVKF